LKNIGQYSRLHFWHRAYEKITFSLKKPFHDWVTASRSRSSAHFGVQIAAFLGGSTPHTGQQRVKKLFFFIDRPINLVRT
jgi:hypothetical protein